MDFEDKEIGYKKPPFDVSQERFTYAVKRVRKARASTNSDGHVASILVITRVTLLSYFRKSPEFVEQYDKGKAEFLNKAMGNLAAVSERQEVCAQGARVNAVSVLLDADKSWTGDLARSGIDFKGRSPLEKIELANDCYTKGLLPHEAHVRIINGAEKELEHQPIDVNFSAVGLKDALCSGGSIERTNALIKIGQLGETEKLNARLIELNTVV